MSLLPESASFEELVQDYFLAVRGAGLMLSALDTELLNSWARLGVPFQVVARGIARSAEKALWDARPGEPVLRNLRACRRQVDAEIKKYLARSAGAGQTESERRSPTWEETRHARLRATLERISEQWPALAPTVEELQGRVLAAVPEEPSQFDAQETRVFLALLRALPFDQRMPLWRAARLEGADAQAMSPRSRRLSRRFRVLVQVRRHLGAVDT
ncbi:hypothetical protein [Stigmatella hybrida]|uniref:hypothetical protein n=1 Tax=Stigmatella hybrida TaxID=394097 RepID=UPI001CDA6625|nr:hypothetical protein [Stigmatella hybrida]